MHSYEIFRMEKIIVTMTCNELYGCIVSKVNCEIFWRAEQGIFDLTMKESQLHIVEIF